MRTTRGTPHFGAMPPTDQIYGRDLFRDRSKENRGRKNRHKLK
jgi:hypothetical protein